MVLAAVAHHAGAIEDETVHHFFSFPGTAAIALLVEAEVPTRLEMEVEVTWTFTEVDDAFFAYQTSPDLLVADALTAVSSKSYLGRVRAATPGWGAEFQGDGLTELAGDKCGRPCEGMWFLSAEDNTTWGLVKTIQPGSWWLVFGAGANREVTTMEYSVALTPEPSSFSMTPSRSGEYLWEMGMSGGSGAYARAAAVGPSAQVGMQRAFTVEGSLFGFSQYVPPTTGIQTHEFVLRGPDGDLPADDLRFIGSRSGTYDFELDNLSIGEWPGRVAGLLFDFPAMPVPES